MKRRMVILLTVSLLMFFARANAQSLFLSSGYLKPDGAITTFYNGNDIEPYFPTLALIIAGDNHLDVSYIAAKWINWLLPRQEASGLFLRFCLKEEKEYQPCGAADADDSMMALWIELLYRMSPRSGMPAAWKESIKKAQYQLDSIYDLRKGVFYISKALPVSLLMDNLEIYSAFKNSEMEALRIGEPKEATEFRLKAANLRRAIIDIFWNEELAGFKASTQAREVENFYPDTIVQLTPIMHDFHISFMKSYSNYYNKWMEDHKEEWFGLIGKDYPWGLLAVIATMQGDPMTANCWQQKSAPYRSGSHWDVLDEAAYQVVEFKLEKKWPKGAPPCRGEKP